MGNVQMGWGGVCIVCACVWVGAGGCLELSGVDGDRLAWENGDADPLIKIDVLPFRFKCN